MAVLPLSQPPIEYLSQGATACRGILINPDADLWLLVSTGGVPVSGTDGAGWAGPGSLVIDPTGLGWYENTGTLASPVWSKFQIGTSSDGMPPRAASIFNARNTDGSALAAAPSAGKFGVAITLGTSAAVIGETSNNTTVTDDLLLDFVMPSDYVAGANFPVTVNAAIVTAGSPTYATKTLQVKAYRVTTAGVMSADLSVGGAQVITPAGADLVWTVTGTTINPGDRLVFEVEGILHDTAGVACHIAVNSLRVG